MSIRPLDMQILLSRADQNFHARQTIVNKNTNEQANFAQIHDRESKQKLNTVQELEDSSKTDYLKREKHKRQSKESKQDFDGNSGEVEDQQRDVLQADDGNYNAKGKKNHFGAKVFDLKI